MEQLVLELNMFLRDSCLQCCAVCLLCGVLMACHESFPGQLVNFLICLLITQGWCIYSSALFSFLHYENTWKALLRMRCSL